MKLYAEYKCKKLFSFKDLVALATILAVILTSVLIQAGNTKRGDYAYISYNNQVKAYNLAKDTDITIDEEKGIYAQIRNGGIAIVESDCKNQICVHTGYVYKTSGTIICAPNNLVIYISNDKRGYVTHA